MHICKYGSNIVKNKLLYIKICRRLIKYDLNLIKSSKLIKSFKTHNKSLIIDKDATNLSNIKNTTYINLLSKIKPIDKLNDSKCVHNSFDNTLNFESFDINHLSKYKLHKDSVLSCFEKLILNRNKNNTSLLFLLDSLNIVLNDLKFDDVYKLISLITHLKLKDTILDAKLESLFYNLLSRLDSILTDNLTHTKGILSTKDLPKYHKESEDTDSVAHSSIDLTSSECFDKLWTLWYNLSRKSDSESQYTSALLLSFLESGTEWIFKFDLRKICRTLDTLVGDSQSFSKAEERLILLSIKRFSSILINKPPSEDGSVYIKHNNITPTQLKKLFCNISKLSKLSPRTLEKALTLKHTPQSLYTYAQLASQVFKIELCKLDLINNQKETDSQSQLNNDDNAVNDLNFKSNRFYLKIFVDLIDIVKFIDYYNLANSHEDESGPQHCNGLNRARSAILELSQQILSKISVNNEELIVSECKGMYYLLLTTALNTTPLDTQTAVYNELVETINGKLTRNSGIMIRILHSTAESHSELTTNNTLLKYVQYLLYCDKISHFINRLDPDMESQINVNDVCRLLSTELHNHASLFFNSAANHVSRTICATLLHKYHLLSHEIYLSFLNNVSNWEIWKPREISMLCDLFRRTYDSFGFTHKLDEIHTNHQTHYQLRCKIVYCLKSLMEYFFHDDNLHRLGNSQFISLLSCMNVYHAHLVATESGDHDFIHDKATDSTNRYSLDTESIRSEILQRIGGMDFNQLVKTLTNFPNYLDDRTRSQIVESIYKLDHLSDVSCLVALNDKEITNRILKTYNIEIVDKNHILFVKLVKNKYLKRYGKLKYNATYTTADKHEFLRQHT